MNDATYDAINAYTRQLADLLLLTDVELEVDREAPRSEHAWAQVWPSDDRHFALISVAPALLAEPREKIRRVLVHELMHIHTNRPWNVMDKIAAMFGDNTACQLACTLAHDEVEVLTEKIARMVEAGLPLPPPALGGPAVKPAQDARK